MLPTLIYEPNAQTRALLLEALDSLPGPSCLRVSAASASAEDIRRFSAQENGISLTILGLSSRDGSQTPGLALGREIMNRNRDNYTVYCVHELDRLGAVLAECYRPAAILLAPFSSEAVAACLRRIVEEYAALHEAAAGQNCLTLDIGASTYRIPFEQINYIEAQDKKLNIFTRRQTITVRSTLNTILPMLPGQFYRCHRSYVVNLGSISKLDLAEMQLTLNSGDRLPVARSSRNELRQRLAEMRGEEQQ